MPEPAESHRGIYPWLSLRPGQWAQRENIANHSAKWDVIRTVKKASVLGINNS